MFDEQEKTLKKKVLKKITQQRLKNIALYYLKRYETSVANLRQVLQKRVNDYAYQNKEFDKAQAFVWIEDIIADFCRFNYVNDERFAEAYVRDRIHFGGWGYYKIKAGLKAKGIDSDVINRILLSAESDGRTVERLSEMMERKNRSLSVSSPGQAKAKLIRFGLSRGFDFETVRAAVEKTLGTEDECD